MAKFSILLPPSELQNKHGNKFAPDVFDYREKTTFNFFHQLIADRRALIDQIHRAIEVDGEEAVAAALGSAQAVRVMKNVYAAELMAARKRYEAGPMFGALDFPGLPTGAQRRFLENSMIISGLFGLLRPDDLVPEYVLPIDADVPGTGPVFDYWRPIISPLVNEAVRGTFLWDLLPAEYRLAWADARTYRARARVRFFDRQGKEMEDTRMLCGRLVNHLVQQNHVTLDSVRSWSAKDAQGFHLDEERSELEQAMNMVVAMSKP